MSFQGPVVGQFGNAEVLFVNDGQSIPLELQVEFELLRLSEKEPALLREWTERLGRKLIRAAQPPPWNILCVAPRMERKVEEVLRDAGLNVYVPLEKFRPRRTWRSRTRPLIPGYIFAELRDDRDLDLARDNYAVHRVMCSEGRPVSVPASEIDKLKTDEAAGAFDMTWSSPAPLRDKSRGRRPPRRKWERGEFAMVTDGPFSSFGATIVKAERADRIEVLVSIFGRVTPVELDEEMLEAIA